MANRAYELCTEISSEAKAAPERSLVEEEDSKSVCLVDTRFSYGIIKLEFRLEFMLSEEKRE